MDVDGGGDLLERIRGETLEVYRASPGRLREDASQEAEIAHDYQGRLIYELLQNADDAMSDDACHADRISFRVTGTDLWVANTGRPLNEADVRGLCGIGASSKGDAEGRRRASIGHKGMGFKSVLELTSIPTVYSTSCSFQMDAVRAAGPVGAVMAELGNAPPRRCPIMRFPWTTASCPEWTKAQEDGYRTLFRFPFDARVTAERRSRLAQDLLDLPVTAILFLKHLEALDIDVDVAGRSERIAWRLERKHRSNEMWRDCPGLDHPGAYQVWVTSDRGEIWCFALGHDDQVEIGSHRGGLNEFAWSGVELTEVTVAALLMGHDADVVPPAWRRFHVFLPTSERCPYPLLVNGAFASDLSRQEIRVDASDDDYNRWLLAAAARVFCDTLLPTLRSEGLTPAQILSLLDLDIASGGDAGDEFHRAMTNALDEVPLIPAHGDLIACVDAAVPPIVAGVLGDDIRRLLPDRATWNGRRLPEVGFCGETFSRIAVDHGAVAMTVSDVPQVLASADPIKARTFRHPSGRFDVDPVLSALEQLWRLVDLPARAALGVAARAAAVFPINIDADGTVTRVRTDDTAAFYPTRSLRADVPLQGIRFLSQEIGWGRLTPQERTEALKDQRPVWQALFDLQEFKFLEVMRTSVLPALVEHDSGSTATNELREALCSADVLAAICQLSGPTPNPASPLPYERLGANRALFNLCRLPVPCRVNGEGPVEWIPAYRAYLGPAWTGGASVSHVLEAVRAHGLDAASLDLPILVDPSELQGLLARYQGLADGDTAMSFDDDGEEVGLDEDEESPLDADEHNRWLRFLTWIGVNRVLRPVHFHDAEDRATGWLKTSRLARPGGWAFQGLGELWDAFQSRIASRYRQLDPEQRTVAYYYRVHDLEHASWLLTAAEGDGTGGIARALYRHLALNWAQLAPFAQAEIALVAVDRYPGQRTPPRAYDDERHFVGDDLWVTRLKQYRCCPTTHGPRTPDRSWLPSAEADRRFGRSGRTAGNLLPLLVSDLPADEKTRAFAQLLGVRTSLSPSTFGVADAYELCSRLAQIYTAKAEAGTLSETELRLVIRPAYRELFELLSGTSIADGSTATQPPLAQAPLLVTDGEGRYRFAPSRQALTVDRAGLREVLGVGTGIWTFVLEGDPAARRPLRVLFGARVLDQALDWRPQPGEAAFDETGDAEFRAGLNDVAPYLLARLRVARGEERLADQDARVLRRFIRGVEPVAHLTVNAALDGTDVPIASQRNSFVHQTGDRLQAFVRWGDQPWPPNSAEQEALAVAITDALQAGYVESFLSLLAAAGPDGRARLLSLAGATGELEPARLALAPNRPEEPTDQSPAEAPPANPSPGEPSVAAPEPGPTPPWRQPESPTVPTIPLLAPHQITFDGIPVLVRGVSDHHFDGHPKQPPKRHESGTSGHAPQGTNLTELDRLGMYVAMTYETVRLARGGTEAQVFDPSLPVVEDTLVFDVSTPRAIHTAEIASTHFKSVMRHLGTHDVSPAFPGIDIMTLRPDDHEWPDRMIELKSSGVNARLQSMTWNEWKTAQHSDLRARFYLYLVGNLRADLPHSAPFIRTIHDPFANLWNTAPTEAILRRAIQLNTQEFDAAEELQLGVTTA